MSEFKVGDIVVKKGFEMLYEVLIVRSRLITLKAVKTGLKVYAYHNELVHYQGETTDREITGREALDNLKRKSNVVEVESFRVLNNLINKSVPKKGVEIERDNDYVYSCGTCKNPIINVEYEPNYCHYCGQRLKENEK